jgi:SAM-dependent methyltransferase
MSVKQIVKQMLPARLFSATRDFPYYLLDLKARLTGDLNGNAVPPLHLMFDGPRDKQTFVRNGAECLEFYKKIVKLPANAAMLDIGSGIGRKTLPLLDYLDAAALYVGIDIDRRGIDWCTRNITVRNPRFLFFPIDIYNKFYNPGGALLPGKVILPFPDRSFDAVVLWSVFTHMYPNDIRHYLSEISRVLKPGGKCVASFYVINPEAITQIKANKAKQPIVHRLADCWTTNPNIPEDLIAVDQDWLSATCAGVGLDLGPGVLPGSWYSDKSMPDFPSLNFQDIAILTKR